MTTKLSAWCERIVEAGWLAALIATPLYFNVHSSRIFEPDKIALLRSIALIMALDVDLARAQANQPNPDVGNPSDPPSNVVAWKVVNIDLISQETDDPLFGRWQPPIRNSELQRLAQAQVVRDFVDSILACDENANVIIAGRVYDPLSSLVGTTLAAPHFASTADLLVKEKRYNRIEDGNSQLTDNILFPKAYLMERRTVWRGGKSHG